MELSAVLERFIEKQIGVLIYTHFFSFQVRWCLKRSLFHFQIRTLGMLRSRFQSIPGAFNDRLVPHDNREDTKKKGFKATFSRKFDQVWLRLLCLAIFTIISLYQNSF